MSILSQNEEFIFEMPQLPAGQTSPYSPFSQEKCKWPMGRRFS